MPSRRLQFSSATGAALSARLDEPADETPLATALFAHCFTCSKDLKAVVEISRALNAAGVAVLRFDFTGLGESAGDFAGTTFSSNVEDLVSAARYLEETGSPPEILIGHSLGGAAVLQAASRVPSAAAVVTIGAPADPGHVTRLLADSLETIRERGEAEVVLAGRRFRIRREFLEDLEAARMEEAIAGLERALLIFHSPVDVIVGVENAARIFQAARHPKSFVSLDRADHLLTDPSDARYVGAVIAAWADKYLCAERRARRRESAPPGGRVAAWIGASGLRTEIVAAGHPLVADEPVAAGGTDRGPTPYDLLLAALGACTAMTLRLYADRKGWPLDEVAVGLAHEKVHARDAGGEGSSRLDRIRLGIRLVGELEAEQRGRLMEIAGRCPVHRTLERGVEMESREPDAVPPAGTNEGGGTG